MFDECRLKVSPLFFFKQQLRSLHTFSRDGRPDFDLELIHQHSTAVDCEGGSQIDQKRSRKRFFPLN
jgi:hypothetical protein